jgi:hypothetical protein
MCAMVVNRYKLVPDVMLEERESPDDARINLIDQRQVLMRLAYWISSTTMASI